MVEVTADIRLHREIGLGQEDGRQLVANDHHQGNQQDTYRVNQDFLVHRV